MTMDPCVPLRAPTASHSRGCLGRGSGRPAPGAAACLCLLVFVLGVGLPGIASAAEAADAKCWVKRLQEKITQCGDYQYQISCYDRKGKQEEQRSFTLFARGARLVRIKVTSGRGKGSEAVLDAQGRVRARKGGLLKSFARTLSPDDGRIRSLRGAPFWDAAAHRFLADLCARMERPDSHCAIGPDPDRPEWLRLVRSSAGGDREQYWIDPQQLVVMKGEVYEDAQLVHRFIISAVRENVGLKDSFFSF
jgi:hypothetical protein